MASTSNHTTSTVLRAAKALRPSEYKKDDTPDSYRRSRRTIPNSRNAVGAPGRGTIFHLDTESYPIHICI
ncbi:hypothetical protein GCM10027174_08010 [Salinifilum aidingensis]